MRCRASARTCATISRRAPDGRSARRASPSTTAAAASAWSDRPCATRSPGDGLLGMVAAPIRAFVRSREGLDVARPAAGLGADADRAGPQGTAHRPPIRHDLLRASDAAGEQGAHPHRVVRSEEAAGDQFQLPVVAGRRRAHRARRSHRLLDHARARARPHADHRDRAGAGPPQRRRDPRLGQEGRRDHLSSRRHLQDGLRRPGRGRLPACGCTASRACASPTPRSCRRSPRATPTRRRS